MADHEIIFMPAVAAFNRAKSLMQAQDFEAAIPQLTTALHKACSGQESAVTAGLVEQLAAFEIGGIEASML